MPRLVPLLTPAPVPAPPVRRARPRRLLMCRPTTFEVSYAINPWMDPTVPVNAALATAQWERLYRLYLALGHSVELIEARPGLPDMVYAANGATVVDGKVLGARFRNAERAAEGDAYLDWFRERGFPEIHRPRYVNEGEGDLLACGGRILAGYGFRTEPEAHREVEEAFGRPVIGLELVDPASTTSTRRSRCWTATRSCTTPRRSRRTAAPCSGACSPTPCWWGGRTPRRSGSTR